MPASNYLHIPAVMHFVRGLQPASILDVGVGNGTYGFLARQLLDIGEERLTAPVWKIRIDGIEIFEGYRNPVWEFAYNDVHLGDIRSLIQDLRAYDLILFNDVLEHLEKLDVARVLDKALQISRCVIVTTPNAHYPQGAWGGNEAEIHRCLLTAVDFPDLITMERAGATTCYVCSRNGSTQSAIRTLALTCPKICDGSLRSALTIIGQRIRRLRYKPAADS